MSWFSRKRSADSEDPLQKRAEELLFAAHASSITIFEPLAKRFPKLLQVELNQFDFVMTVASVFVAVARLANSPLDQGRKKKLCWIINQKLDEWDPDGIRGIEDCQKLFEREFDRLSQNGLAANVAVFDAIGIWIVWNMLGHGPDTAEECQLVRDTGTVAITSFSDWWNLPNGADA